MSGDQEGLIGVVGQETDEDNHLGDVYNSWLSGLQTSVTSLRILPSLTFPTTKPQRATVEPLRTFESQSALHCNHIISLGQQWLKEKGGLQM